MQDGEGGGSGGNAHGLKNPGHAVAQWSGRCAILKIPGLLLGVICSNGAGQEKGERTEKSKSRGRLQNFSAKRLEKFWSTLYFDFSGVEHGNLKKTFHDA